MQKTYRKMIKNVQEKSEKSADKNTEGGLVATSSSNPSAVTGIEKPQRVLRNRLTLEERKAKEARTAEEKKAKREQEKKAKVKFNKKLHFDFFLFFFFKNLYVLKFFFTFLGNA